MFNETSSNAIISKGKNIFCIFFWISEISTRFQIIWKKDESHRLFVSETIECKKRGSLKRGSKKPRSRTLLESQYVRGSETLHKSARQYFCQIFWSLWKKISSKISFLVVCEILRLFVNILTPNDKHSLSVKESI